MFKRHPYGEHLAGFLSPQGEVILGDPPGALEVVQKTTPNLFVGLHAKDRQACEDFEHALGYAIPYTYSRHIYLTSLVPDIWSALDHLFAISAEKRLKEFCPLLELWMPGYEKRLAVETLRGLLQRLDVGHIVLLTLPSAEHERAILGLGGQIVTLDDRPMDVQAKEFAAGLPFHVGWQTGEPPTMGTYKAKWVRGQDSDLTPQTLACFIPATDTEPSAWMTDGQNVPLQPPTHWRPLQVEEELGSE